MQVQVRVLMTCAVRVQHHVCACAHKSGRVTFIRENPVLFMCCAAVSQRIRRQHPVKRDLSSSSAWIFFSVRHSK